MIKKNFFINSSFILLIFLLDRISKIIVINLDENSFNEVIYSSKFLDIELMWNKGIAFGLLSFNKDILYNFLTIFISVIVIIILFLLLKSKGIVRYAFLMILGGALGNLFDRIFYKAVPDFIDFHVQNFHWFIFNVSDIFITIGVLFLIFSEFVNKKEPN